MADLALTFDILAKDSASAAFRKVGDEAESSGNKLTGAAKGLNSIAGGIIAAGAAFAGTAIIAGFKSLYDAAADSQRIGRLTEQVIRSTGGAANVTADQVGDLATAISQKTGVDDEAIQSGENLLLTFTNLRNEAGQGNNIFDQTTQIMTDMSAALGTDASGSAIQLGKALNDPIKGVTALTKVGVSFTEQQKDQIAALVQSGDLLGAQKIILGELTTEFGGAAAAAATPLDKLKVTIGNVAESLGGVLIPIVNDFATKAVSAITDVSDGFSSGQVTADGFDGAMQQLGVAVHDVADSVGFLVGVAKDLFGFFIDLPGPVQAGVLAMGAFAALKSPVSDAMETIALKALYARDAVTEAGGGMGVLKGGAMGVVDLLGGPWGIALGAATIGLGFLTSALSSNDDAAESASAAQSTFADAVREANGAINDSVRAAAAKAAQDAGLLDIADDLGLSLPQVTDAVLGNRDAYDALVTAANAYKDTALESQNAGDLGMTQNADEVNGFIDSLNTLTPTVDQVRQQQEALASATDSATSSQGSATAAVDALAASQKQLSDDTSAAKQAIDAIRLALDQLGGATVNTVDLESALYAAVATASGAMDGLAGSVINASGGLDVQSAAGRQAADVLGNIRGAGLDLISNQAQLGESTDQLTGRANDLRGQFIAAAGQMGINADQAGALADSYGLIPDQVVTTIQANSASAVAAAQQVQNALDALPSVKTIRIVTDSSGATIGRSFSNGVAAAAEGGPVGPGRFTLVGERGPELVEFGGNAFVTPAAQTARVLSAAPVGPTFGGASMTSASTSATGPRTVINDNRQVYATVDSRSLSRQMQRDQADLEFLHG